MVNLARPRDWGHQPGQAKRGRRWIPLGLAAAGLVAGIVATVGSAGSGDNGGSVPAFRPGDPAVYARIAVATKCADLQDEFGSADQTRQRGDLWGPIGSSYRDAAETRMREIGCY